MPTDYGRPMARCSRIGRVAIIDLAMTAAAHDRPGETGNVIDYNGEIYKLTGSCARAAQGRVRVPHADRPEVISERLRPVGGSGLSPSPARQFAFALWDARETVAAAPRCEWGISSALGGGEPKWQANSSLRVGVRTSWAQGLNSRKDQDRSNRDGSFLWNGFTVGTDIE